MSETVMVKTFADEIESAAADQSIDAVVIGPIGGYDWPDDDVDPRHQPGLANQGRVLTWDEARPLLDYEYDSGYGGADCHAIYAYTASRVIFVSQYDGSTAVVWVPREPVADEGVSMPGGG